MHDPLKLFSQAEIYRYAARVLGVQARAQVPQLSIPSAVIGAFALELYLKCLIALELNDPKKEHDLVKLFRMISSPVQDKIRYVFSNQDPITTRLRKALESKIGRTIDFDLALNRSRNVFTNWRYLDSDKWDDGASGWSTDILEVTRRVILELREDWPRELKIEAPNS